MHEKFISDEEYPGYFSTLTDLRTRIAARLPVKPRSRILDLATGYGYFAFVVVKKNPSVSIIGIDISPGDVKEAARNAKRLGLEDRSSFATMDATRMDFADDQFDMVVNFLGLEDIFMTRARQGIEKTFSEVARVLKPRGYFCFTVKPPEEAETEAQRIEDEVFSWLCGATWLPASDYERMLTDNGFCLMTRKTYRTGKKLNIEQAKEEIRFACKNVPRIYGVKTPSFDEVWARFGSRIERHGMGHYSKVVLMISQNSDGYKPL